MKSILEILADIRPEVDFQNHIDYIQNGMLDSFDLILLVSELEKEYFINIPGNEIVAENFQSLDAIVNLVQKCGGKM
jgi:acyl carrier protein